MKSDDIIDDVEKVMEKFKLLQSKLEGEFSELVAKAKKIKEAKEQKYDKTKKGVEEMKDKPNIENMRIVSKRVRRVR
jgi:flagellar motility protein MotE (MotC chaperone)